MLVKTCVLKKILAVEMERIIYVIYPLVVYSIEILVD